MKNALLSLIEQIGASDHQVDLKVLLEALRKQLVELPLTEEETQALTVLDELDLRHEVEDVQDELKKLLALYQDYQLDALIKRLREIQPAQEITAPIVDLDDNLAFKALPINGVFKAKLDTEIEIFETSPDQMPIKLTPDQRVLRLGLDGETDVNGAVAGPVGVISLQANAGFQGEAELDYYFRTDADQLLATAILHNFPALESPLGLPQVTDPEKERLRTLRLSAKGSAVFGAGFTVGKTGSVTMYEGSANQIGVGYDIGLGVDFGYKVDGEFHLLRSLQPDGKYTVTLTRKRTQQTHSRISVGGDFGVTGLDKVLTKLINDYLPDAQKLVDKLKIYTDLRMAVREALSEQLDALLSNEELRAVLLKAYDGKLTETELAEFLKEEAEHILEDEFLSLVVKGDAAAGGLADSLVKRLNDAAPGMVDEPDIRDALLKLVKKVGSVSLAKLKKLIEGVIDLGVPELFKPLEFLGKKAEAFFAEAQESVDKVLLPVLEFLGKYNAIRAKLLKAAQASAKLKLSLSMARSRERIRQEGLNLKFIIDPTTPEADRYYRAMTIGRFERAMRAAFSAAEGISIDPDSTFTVRDFARKSFDFKFIGLGLSLTATNWASTDVEATVDLHGDITVGLKGEAGHQATLLGETRTGRFFSDINLAGALNESQTDNKLLNFGVSLSYSDEDLERDEITAYLKPFLDMDMVRQDALNELLARYDAIRSPNAATKAEMGLTLSLESDQLKRLAKIAEGPSLEIVFFSNLFDYLLNHRTTRSRHLPELLKLDKDDENLPTLVAQKVYATPMKTWQDMFRDRRLHSSYRMEVTKIMNAKKLAERLKDGFAKVSELMSVNPSTTKRDHIKDLQDDINRDFKPFTIVGSDLIETLLTGGKTSVRWRNVIFFKTVAELVNPGEHIPIVVQWRNADQDQDIFI